MTLLGYQQEIAMSLEQRVSSPTTFTQWQHVVRGIRVDVAGVSSEAKVYSRAAVYLNASILKKVCGRGTSTHGSW